jgi:hypothetical protein
VAGLARRWDPERLQQQVPHAVEQIDQRLREKVEEPHPWRHDEHGPVGTRDREALRGQLADDHVQERNEGEGECSRDRYAAEDGSVPEHPVQKLLKHRLADDSEADARDRDAELAGGQIGVDVVDGVAYRLRSRPAFLLEVVDLGRAKTGDREFGGHEEAVRDD